MKLDNSDWDGDLHGPVHRSPELGGLIAGLSAGMGYAGHNLSLADAIAASIAIQLAVEHGASLQLQGHQSGYLQDVPALREGPPHAPDGPYRWEDAGRVLQLPGIARDATTVDVLCWPHGHPVQWPWRRIRARAEVEHLERYRPNIVELVEYERVEARLLDCGLFGDPAAQPNGWYRGAVGTTYVWRDFFRIRPRQPLFGKAKESYENHRTFLVATGAMWHYSHVSVTGDWETRVAFSVYSLPFVDAARQWAYRWDQIKQYRAIAEGLAAALRRELEAIPPSPLAIQERRSMDPALTRGLP